MTQVGVWLKQVASRLSHRDGVDRPAFLARLLLAHVLKKTPTWLLAHPEHALSEAQEAQLERMVARLERGEPLPYVLGEGEFYGLDFRLTPAVLIPRPETELLVEVALDWLRHHPAQRWAMDVGTGSGCVAIALAVHLPDLKLLASDISWDALSLARENAQRHGVSERILWLQGDLLSAVRGKFDLICANLPYIPSERLPDLEVARYEPHLALNGGESGLVLIRRLLEQSEALLASPGLLLLEVDSAHAHEAALLGQASFPKARLELQRDLAGKERLLGIALESG